MSSKKKQAELREEKDWERIDNAVVQSENFLTKYSKQILIVIGIAVVAACGYIAYKQLYLEPKSLEAQDAMYKGQQYFEARNDSAALFGDPNGYVGFEAIATDYSATKPGNLAKGYAGICHFRLGNNEKALEYLKSYSHSGDMIFSNLINATIGDCLINQGKTEEAITHYIKAAKELDNVIQSPVLYKKAALLHRDLGNNDKVIEIFTLIQNQYMKSPYADEAEKYIIEAKLAKGN